jgi:hypothetical protein
VQVPVVNLAEAEGLTPRLNIDGTPAKAPWWQKFRVRAAAKRAAKLVPTVEEKARPQTGSSATAAQVEASAGGACASQLMGTTAKAQDAPVFPPPPPPPAPTLPPPPAPTLPWMRGKEDQKGGSGKVKPKGGGKGKSVARGKQK